MNIEAIVKKYKEDAPLCSYDFDQSDAETMLSAALTELASGYEQKILTLKNEVLRESEERCRMSEAAEMLQERIRQLEAELVPEKMFVGDAPLRHPLIHDGYVAGWNACRDAMLAAQQQPKKEGE